MSEPILHMSERKDSLDIMYEMNMQELLRNPVVVEVLNLVYEGKFSVSSSALSMSQTFFVLRPSDEFLWKIFVQLYAAKAIAFFSTPPSLVNV